MSLSGSLIGKQFDRVNDEESKNNIDYNPLNLSAILKFIDDEILVVPEFQRDFKWNLDRFVLLFDSVYRGYTIGNLLLWKSRHCLAHKTVGADKTKTIDEIEKNKEYTYVLDGQQRLTTLYGVLRGKKISLNGKKPKLRRIYFDVKNDVFIKETQKIEDLDDRNIKKVIDDDFDKFRFIDMSQIFNEGLNFPSNLIDPDLNRNDEKFTKNEITKDQFIQANHELKKKEKMLKQFSEVIKSFKIPQIVNFDENIDKVVTVFERINTQNMQLDIYDIMVAKTYQEVKFNDKIYTFNLGRAVDKLRYKSSLRVDELAPDETLSADKNLYYEIGRVTLLRMLSIFLNRDEKIALQKTDIYNLKAQGIQDNIGDFRTQLYDLHCYFKNQLNLDDLNEGYTSNNTLSFLMYVFSKVSYKDSNSELLNLWFWNSVIFNRFPGAQLELIEKDATAFCEGEDVFKKIISKRRDLSIFSNVCLLNGVKLIDAGYHEVKSKLYQSCILLLNSLKPIDFNGKYEINLVASYVRNDTKINKHHIIPYNSAAGKQFRKQDPKGEFIINNIANIALISADLNKEISKKTPKEYFKLYESGPGFKDVLKRHLIDEEMYQDLKDEKYEDFLIARTKKILGLIEKKCAIDGEKLELGTHDPNEEEENGD